MLVRLGDLEPVTAAQILLCGITRLDAAVVPGPGGNAEADRILSFFRPGSLFLTDPDSDAAGSGEKQNTRAAVPKAGQWFDLGGAKVSFEASRDQSTGEERAGSLFLRVDFGNASACILPAPADPAGPAGSDRAGLLICLGEGVLESLADQEGFVFPQEVVDYDNTDWRTKERLRQSGTAVRSLRNHEVLTFRSDGGEWETE